MTLDRYAKDFAFYIHIDAKSRMKESDLHLYSSVKVIKKYNVNWGGTNHLKAFIDLMRLAFEMADYDFFHLITGQDIIVAPKSEFSLKQGFNYMSYGKASELWTPSIVDNRYNYYRFLDLFDFWNSKMRRIEHMLFMCQKFFRIRRGSLGIQMWGGSTYCSLARDSVDYVLNNGMRLLRRLANTYIPEELFFQTLLLNSPYKNKIINDNKRMIVWPGPKTLSIEDFGEMTSGKYLFARKIDIVKSHELLKRVYC